MPAQESKYDSTRFDEILKILSGWRVSEPEACPDDSTVCLKVELSCSILNPLLKLFLIFSHCPYHAQQKAVLHL